ncbi:MAG: oligosaccharide flippase family protein [Paraglaciecola sp.]|nr:oligosaccharide flippase family protein [Paraglaciecola sp.]
MGGFKKASVASILLIIEQVAIKLVGLVSTLILARLIMPEDFGIIAIALLVVGFIEILSQTGSAQYLLRVETLDDDKINTAWTINLILKSVISIVMFAASFWAANYYDDPRLINLISALTLIFLFYNLYNPGLAYLRRAQEYGKIVKLTVYTKIFAVLATVFAALLLENYWALVIGKAAGAVSMVIGSNIIYPYKRKFQLTNAKAQWRFSGWMIPEAVFGYVRTQFDTFLVSSTFGQAALGSYHTMKYIAYMPNAYLLIPITQPFIVELRKASIDKNYFDKQYNSSFVLLMLIGMPITTLMFSYPELITLVLLGKNWVEHSYLFGIFAGLIPAFIMLNHATRLLILHAKTKQLFFYSCISFAAIYTPLLILGVADLKLFSIVRVSLENLTTFIFLITVTLIYTGARNTLRFFLSTAPVFVACYIAFLISKWLSVNNINAFIELVYVSIIFMLTFTMAILALHFSVLKYSRDWQYLESLITRILISVFKKK